MSHHSHVRRFRPLFDSLSSRVTPSTLGPNVPCPMDPTIIMPPTLIKPTSPTNPMDAALILNVPLQYGMG